METWITRAVDLNKRNKPKRVTLIYGPRRVGKTSLVEHWLSGLPDQRILRAVGDDAMVRALLSSQDASRIQAWVAGYDILALDEAQRIPEVGWALKILVDACPNLTIIATGSASFALAGQVGEPLTGRQTPIALYPVWVGELPHNNYELNQALEGMLVFGMYPEVRTAGSDFERGEILKELVGSYLMKDILELERVKSSGVLVDLLTLVALQIGNLVSINELASSLGINAKTVARYLDLFEKSYVLYNLRGFSRNLREEVTRNSKYYFYDTGIRNAVLGNFSRLTQRDDVGALWENFLLMERIKAHAYHRQDARLFFWRTWQQSEIDLVEQSNGQLGAFEFKWNPKRKATRPGQFAAAYPLASYEVVNQDNWLSFVLPPTPDSPNDSAGRVPQPPVKP